MGDRVCEGGAETRVDSLRGRTAGGEREGGFDDEDADEDDVPGVSVVVSGVVLSLIEGINESLEREETLEYERRAGTGGGGPVPSTTPTTRGSTRGGIGGGGVSSVLVTP